MARKFGMGFFDLVQGFFWVLIFALIRSSLSLEIRSSPSGLELAEKLYEDAEFFTLFIPS